MKLPRVSTIGDLTVDATLLQTVSLFTNTRSSLFLFSRTRPRAHTYTHTHTHTHSLSLSSFWNSGYGAFSRGDTIIEFLARISWPRTPTVYSVTAAIFGYNVQTLIFQGKVRKCVEMRRRRDKRRQNRVVTKEETSFKNLTIFHCICIFFFFKNSLWRSLRWCGECSYSSLSIYQSFAATDKSYYNNKIYRLKGNSSVCLVKVWSKADRWMLEARFIIFPKDAKTEANQLRNYVRQTNDFIFSVLRPFFQQQRHRTAMNVWTGKLGISNNPLWDERIWEWKRERER